jgi:hypothetical protein
MNNSNYNDLIELKWTLLTDEEVIDENIYGPKKRSVWENSSEILESLKQDLMGKLSSYSSFTTTSYLPSLEEKMDYLVGNQSEDLLSSLNETQTNESVYYFYKVFIQHFSIYFLCCSFNQIVQSSVLYKN